MYAKTTTQEMHFSGGEVTTVKESIELDIPEGFMDKIAVYSGPVTLVNPGTAGADMDITMTVSQGGELIDSEEILTTTDSENVSSESSTDLQAPAGESVVQDYVYEGLGLNVSLEVGPDSAEIAIDGDQDVPIQIQPVVRTV